MSGGIRIAIHRGTPSGELVADLTRHVRSCRWSYNRHGCRELEATAPRRFLEAMRLYRSAGLLWVVASRGARRLWVGRLSAPELWADDGGSGITVRALGHWAALDDLPYTALWSVTGVEDWREMTPQDRAGRFPERWEIDTNNRLFIGLKQGQAYNSSVIGALGFQAPDQGVRDLATFSADVEHNLPASAWTIELTRFSGGFGGSAATVTTITGAGALTTTTISASWAAATDALMLQLYFNSGSSSVYAGEDGASYVRLTNVRITSGGAPLYADVIVSRIATSVALLNPGVIVGSAVDTPGLDLTDEVYEDAAPTDVLNRIAGRGDGTGTVYVAGVDEHGYVYLRPWGQGGQAWAVDAGDIRVVSERDSLVNSAYGVYKDAGGRPLRTATASDASSVGRYGYTRRQAVAADTTTSARAEAHRDLVVADGATASPSGDISIERVLTVSGGRGSRYDVRPGDTLTVRNLPLAGVVSAEVDRLRTMRIAEVTVDPVARRLVVTPETPLPRLEVLLAQGAL